MFDIVYARLDLTVPILIFFLEMSIPIQAFSRNEGSLAWPIGYKGILLFEILYAYSSCNALFGTFGILFMERHI